MTGDYHRQFLGEFFLTHMTPIMGAMFFLFVILLILNFKSIKKSLKIKRKTAIILLLIFLFGFYLRNMEYRYGWGLDGFFFPTSAYLLKENGVFAMGCAIGKFNDCKLYNQPLFTAGYPFLILLLYYLFGYNSLYAMVISGILGSLTIVLVFYILYLLFKNEEIGLYGAIIFLLLPLEMVTTGTSAVRTTSLFFVALTLLLYLLSIKIDSIKMWSLFAVTLSYTLYVRHENIILLGPLTLGFFLFYHKGKILEFFSVKNLKKFSIPLLIFLIMSIPFFHWMLFKNVYYGQPTFAFKYFKVMAPIMIENMFSPPKMFIRQIFNPFLSVLFFLSLFLLFDKKLRKPLIFLWSIFIVFFLIIASYFQTPGFPEVMSGDYIRFMQNLDIAYALIISVIVYTFKKKQNYNMYLFLIVFFLVIFISSNLELKPHIFKDGRLEEDVGYIGVGDLIRSINKTPENCAIIISQATLVGSDILKNNQRTAIDIELVMAEDGNLSLNEMKNVGCIRFLKDYRCTYDLDKLCQFIYDNIDLRYVEVYEGKLKS